MNAMVTYITKVVVELPENNLKENKLYSLANLQLDAIDMQKRWEHVTKLANVLAKQGFEFWRKGNKLIAYSTEVEAFAIKRDLLDAGFSNHDFSIHLDYTRKWGTL